MTAGGLWELVVIRCVPSTIRLKGFRRTFLRTEGEGLLRGDSIFASVYK
jgi:hypothetical protein